MRNLLPISLSIVLIALLVGCNSSRQERTESQMMVTCPMCGGSGIFEYMPGDVMAPRVQCAGCNGTGMCTEQQASNIQQTLDQFNQNFNGGGGSSPHRSGRSAYEIQRDLDKAYRLLADMERQYQECSSVTIAAQYPHMIQQQRERIERLEDELRRATH